VAWWHTQPSASEGRIPVSGYAWRRAAADYRDVATVQPIPRTAPVRVLLCDDAPDLRALLRCFLAREADVEVVGEAADGTGIVDHVRSAGAAAVLIDLAMPRTDGLEAIVALRAAYPDLCIVVLSGFERARMERRALALGADSYVEKAASLDEVVTTLRTAVAARSAA
jgi:DNA-binding NarL/FixJ family response regulator